MLDSHGKLAVLEMIIYIPVAFFCIFNNIKHGFRREAGWIYLTLFCGVKLSGAGMTIHIQESEDTSLLTTATVLNSVALSPLLNATLSFLNAHPKDTDQSFMRRASFFLKPLHLMIIVGLGLSVIGGIDETKLDQTDLDNGAKALKIASALFVLAWTGLLIGCLIFLFHLSELTRSHRRMVLAVALALPFLLVRVVYSALNAVNLNTSGSEHTTNKWNPVTGSWVLYLILGLAMETATVGIYSFTGVLAYHEAKALRISQDGSHLELLSR
ncbi:hypothetical protein VTN77DRAFT_1635 [Rasamsonia byssochlamydoides]|uniref:uncharacterized protein n=1 Tax=Rasamsonia byssochlamydoides TaxID=89139 RepID=UPI003742C601